MTYPVRKFPGSIVEVCNSFSHIFHIFHISHTYMITCVYQIPSISAKKASQASLSVASQLPFFSASSQLPFFSASFQSQIFHIRLHSVIFKSLPPNSHQTLYIYLSTAALLGLLAGLTLYFAKNVLTSLLQLSPSFIPPSTRPSKPARRSISQYRASRKTKQENLKRLPLTDLNRFPLADLNLDAAGFAGLSPRSLTSPNLPPTMTHSPTRTDGKVVGMGMGAGRWSRKGLLSPQTIMEEGDSDEYF
jgi:hypothetical protein